MMHADERDTERHRKSLRKIRPHEQRTEKPWRIRHSDGSQIRHVQRGLRKRFFDDRYDCLQMRT